LALSARPLKRGQSSTTALFDNGLGAKNCVHRSSANEEKQKKRNHTKLEILVTPQAIFDLEHVFNPKATYSYIKAVGRKTFSHPKDIPSKEDKKL